MSRRWLPVRSSGAELRAAIYDRLTRSLGKEPETATPRDIYDALSLAVREELSARWLATQRRVARARVKRLCYLSVEFLPGRSLVNALSSLDSRAHRRGARRGRQHGPRFRCRGRARGRSRTRQWRSRPSRGLFPRFARDVAVPGHGLRHPLRLRHLHAVDRHRRRAARIGEHLAAAAQRLGDAALGCALHRALRRPRADDTRRRRRDALALGRDAGRARRRLRPARPGQSQPDGESPAAVVGARAAAVPHRRLQRRQLSGRGRRPGRGEESFARAVSRTTPRRRARSCASSSSTSS